MWSEEVDGLKVSIWDDGLEPEYLAERVGWRRRQEDAELGLW